MKSLLNITVFASAVLSIFSTSLTLYEVPELKEAISVIEEERSEQLSELGKEMKRIYISHDTSTDSKKEFKPFIVSNVVENVPTSTQENINVFGVQVSKSNNQRNI